METISYDIAETTLKICLSGPYLGLNLPQDLLEIVRKAEISDVKIDAKLLTDWDSSLLALLFFLSQAAQERNLRLQMQNLPEGVQKLLALSAADVPHQKVQSSPHPDFLDRFGAFWLDVFAAFKRGFSFCAVNLKAFFASFTTKTTMRRVDFLFALQECAPSALPIVLLISFMVGLILAFVGAVQLQTFGAQIYVASLVTIGMTRIMGAIMVGIIMAGRTGASFAATIGTMQVNEEVDALRTMGIQIEQFLVLPRMKALVYAMPILTMLADFAGILGGAFVAVFALEIPASEFFKYAYKAWYLRHFLVGIFHALVFGFIIALSGCYFGVECARNADGVGKSTTNAVVFGIVWMIVATGIITFIFQRMGI